MNYALPPADRVLILAPHPDDESLGCGGTIAHYTHRRARTKLIVISDGAALAEQGRTDGNLVEERGRETTTAAQVLGIQQIEALGFPDGQLRHHTEEICAVLRARIAAFEPELIFCPSPISSHPDHVTVGRLMLQLLREMTGWSLVFYEIHGPLRPNFLIDITDVLALKEKAVLSYYRSLFGHPALFWSAVRSFNLSWSFVTQRRGFFEAFWLVPVPLSDQEVIDWMTFHFTPGTEALSSPLVLQGLDELLLIVKEKSTEAQHAHQRAEVLQLEVERLLSELRQKEQEAVALRHAVEARNHELSLLERSPTAWAKRFLSWRVHSAFPVGSRARVALRTVKHVWNQCTSKSLRE